MWLEYLYFFKFFLFSMVFVILLFFLSFFFVYQKPDLEKLSSYECGFNPWGDARSKFEVRFYLVAILFIIFDVEIIFLFPWIINLTKMGFLGFYSFIAFILFLTLASFMNGLKVLWIGNNYAFIF